MTSIRKVQSGINNFRLIRFRLLSAIIPPEFLKYEDKQLVIKLHCILAGALHPIKSQIYKYCYFI